MVNRSVISFLGAAEKISVVAIILAVLIWTPVVVGELRTVRLEQELAFVNFMEVRDVSVGNTVQGQPVILDVDREIKQDFIGSYIVEVRTFPARRTVCIAADRLAYDPDARLPDTITLAWWANDGECGGADLSPGDYVIRTTWTIHNDEPKVSDQSLTVESNPFTVFAVDAETVIQEQQQLQEQVDSLTRSLRLLEAEDADK